MGRVKDDMTLNGMTVERLGDRRGLLAAFDSFRRDADATGAMVGVDAFTQEAFDILTSSRLVEALDISKEPSKLRERYGKGTDKIQGDAAPRLNEQFLLARRLVEAGVCGAGVDRFKLAPEIPVVADFHMEQAGGAILKRGVVIEGEGDRPGGQRLGKGQQGKAGGA